MEMWFRHFSESRFYPIILFLSKGNKRKELNKITIEEETNR
jgi:hypothetical protein